MVLRMAFRLVRGDFRVLGQVLVQVGFVVTRLSNRGKRRCLLLGCLRRARKVGAGLVGQIFVGVLLLALGRLL